MERKELEFDAVVQINEIQRFGAIKRSKLEWNGIRCCWATDIAWSFPQIRKSAPMCLFQAPS